MQEADEKAEKQKEKRQTRSRAPLSSANSRISHMAHGLMRAANRSKGTQRPTTATIHDLVALMEGGNVGVIGDLLDFLGWMLHSHHWQTIDKDHSGNLSIYEVGLAIRRSVAE